MRSEVFTREEVIEAFLSAAESGNCKRVESMLSHHMTVDDVDDDQVTALQIAAAHGNIELMQLLLNYGAEVDKCNELGYTALHHACRNGHLKAVEFLLKNGADSKRSTFLGTNAITLATASGCLDIVTLLYTMCEKPQRIAPSPLAVAISKRRFEIIAFFKFLKNVPSWYKQCGVFNLSAVEVARILGDEVTSEFLYDIDSVLEKGTAELVPDIRCLIHDGNIKQLRRILHHNSKIAPLPDGTVPLMFAAVVGNLKMVELLVGYGVDINASIDGFTSLTIAAICGNEEVALYLNKLGAESYGEISQEAVKYLSRSSELLPSVVKSIFTRERFARKEPSSWAKVVRHFEKKKAQLLKHDSKKIVIPNRLAFRERVTHFLGPYASQLPKRLFARLVCPHDAHALNFGIDMGTQENAKLFCPFRIMDLFGAEKIHALFKVPGEDNAYFPHYRLQGSVSSLNRSIAHHHGSYRYQKFSSSPGTSESAHFGQERHRKFERNVSKLRSKMFKFDYSRDEKSVILARRIRDEILFDEIFKRCGPGVWRVLKGEGCDDHIAFSLLKKDDFEVLFSDNHLVKTLLQIQKDLSAGHVEYY